jgi:hypothetical protein
MYPVILSLAPTHCLHTAYTNVCIEHFGAALGYIEPLIGARDEIHLTAMLPLNVITMRHLLR